MVLLENTYVTEALQNVTEILGVCYRTLQIVTDRLFCVTDCYRHAILRYRMLQIIVLSGQGMLQKRYRMLQIR